MAEAERRVSTSLTHITAQDAERRIGDWFDRGYVMFSDVNTRSTHLRRAESGGVRSTATRRRRSSRRRPSMNERL